MKVEPKVDEAIETLNMKDGPTRRRLLSGAGLVSASAAAAGLLAACTSSGSTAAAGTISARGKIERALAMTRSTMRSARSYSCSTST